MIEKSVLPDVSIPENDVFVNLYDMTRSLASVIRTYRNDFTSLYRDVVTIDGLQTMSSLKISPHAVTHIDLPDFLPPQYINEVRRGGNQAVWEDEVKEQILPQTCSQNCLLIDISSYDQIIYNALAELKIDNVSEIDTYCWKKGQFTQILNALRISRSEIEWLKDFSNCIILFYTGWNQFAPLDGDLHDPSWAPWHPYFVHPYLDQEAVEYLFLDENGPAALGIGCDIFSLEIPLRHIQSIPSNILLPEIKEELKILDQAENESMWPLHHCALLNNRYLIEQLYIPIELFLHQSAQKNDMTSYIKGRLLLLPYNFSKSQEAKLVSAFYSPEGWAENV